MPVTKKRKVDAAPVVEIEGTPSISESVTETSSHPDDAPEDNDNTTETEPRTLKTFKELGLIDSLCEAW